MYLLSWYGINDINDVNTDTGIHIEKFPCRTGTGFPANLTGLEMCQRSRIRKEQSSILLFAPESCSLILFPQ